MPSVRGTRCSPMRPLRWSIRRTKSSPPYWARWRRPSSASTTATFRWPPTQYDENSTAWRSARSSTDRDGWGSMRVIVVGLGVQGHKRRRFAGADFVAAVDPVNREAEYLSVEDVPLADFDAALLCVPDEPKIGLLSYLLGNGKHCLVEKPLWAENDADIERLATLAREKRALCYTAYNHRFEPHFVRMRDLIASGELGEIYR